ncbi:hypothetical protein GQ457_04G034910 [Hibiscus cannabinus]
MDASRPSLGFPLGTVLLLIIIFSLSGIFSCCYHWDKLKYLRGSFSDAAADADIEASPSKNNPNDTDVKKNQGQSLPVLMPGDKIPKFIALPCPCEPPREVKVVIEEQVQKVTPKSPRFPVPLY